MLAPSCLFICEWIRSTEHDLSEAVLFSEDRKELLRHKMTWGSKVCILPRERRQSEETPHCAILSTRCSRKGTAVGTVVLQHGEKKRRRGPRASAGGEPLWDDAVVVCS